MSTSKVTLLWISLHRYHRFVYWVFVVAWRISDLEIIILRQKIKITLWKLKIRCKKTWTVISVCAKDTFLFKSASTRRHSLKDIGSQSIDWEELLNKSLESWHAMQTTAFIRLMASTWRQEECLNPHFSPEFSQLYLRYLLGNSIHSKINKMS